ncbi:hypothetical protein ABZX90_39310 [Streptomyces sp. NPDC002935]|uniref:hypothetical protein n=1 Tax=unclassified Streptomyces TaxID=2593676 RepID=UPI0033279F59
MQWTGRAPLRTASSRSAKTSVGRGWGAGRRVASADVLAVGCASPGAAAGDGLPATTADDGLPAATAEARLPDATPDARLPDATVAC